MQHCPAGYSRPMPLASSARLCFSSRAVTFVQASIVLPHLVTDRPGIFSGDPCRERDSCLIIAKWLRGHLKGGAAFVLEDAYVHPRQIMGHVGPALAFTSRP